MHFKNSLTALLLLGALLTACAGPPPAAETSTAPTASPVEQSTIAPVATAVAIPAETAASKVATQEPAGAATTVAETAPASTAVPTAASRAGRVLYLRFDFTQQRDELHSVALDGADDRLLWACQAPCDITGLAAAPAGDAVAFAVRGPGEPDGLYVADREVSDPRKIVTGSVEIGAQGWSRDGHRLAIRQLREAGQAPVPQGTIAITDRSGATPLQLTPAHYFLGAPLWLDEQYLLYSQAETGTPPAGWQTNRVDAGGKLQTEKVTAGELVAASPDRMRLLVMLETVPNDSSRRALALAPLDGGEPQRIAENVPPSATWAPDGRSFVFLDALSSGIIQVHVDDGRRTELRRFDDMQNYPFMLFAWGPDVRTLFYTKTGAGKSDLRRLDLATQNEQVLATYEGDPQPLVVLP